MAEASQQLPSAQPPAVAPATNGASQAPESSSSEGQTATSQGHENPSLATPAPAPAAGPSPRPQPVRVHLQSPYAGVGAPVTSAPASASSSAASLPPQAPRGGVAVGVPARMTQPKGFVGFTPPPPLAQQFGQLHRPPDPSQQVRQPSPGIQNIGMIGSINNVQMRPTVVTSLQQQRLVQPSTAPASSAANQVHASPRVPGARPVRALLVPSSSQQMQSISVAQTYRPQQGPQVLQRRPFHPQQSASSNQHNLLAPQQQQLQQKQQVPQPQALQHLPRELQPTMLARNQQHPLPQQPGRPPVPMSQRPDFALQAQTGRVQTGGSTLVNVDNTEEGNKILSKRTIREMVAQIDPSERFDADVEDVLVEIAEDFVENIATFACSLAKHRKSSTLEGKDVLLHAERSWNITLPGFSGDDIKTVKKPLVNEIHRERLAAVKKSMAASGEGGNPKSIQTAANQKAQTAKFPALMGSPSS